MNQEGLREHFFGFEYGVVITEEAEVPKAPETDKKIDRGGGSMI